MTSYITLLNKIEAFCNAHLQIKKYGGEFREQMPNFATIDEKYPVVFVTPTSDTENLNTNQFTIDIYCVDIIQADRANLNNIISDCQLILKDMYVYYTNDNDSDIDVVGSANMTPLNNIDLDYVAGWVMSITFEVASYGSCAIPMTPIEPNPTPDCEDATVENSDLSYQSPIASGDTLVLRDINFTDSDGTTTQVPSVTDIVATACVAIPIGAKLMKTGQTTSYRTGDDGDLESGRATSFTVLASNNPFGNTKRFTDELGGQIYTNNIVIDWSTFDGSTVLGLERIANGNFNWNTNIDNAISHSVGIFTTGWRLPNIREIESFALMSSVYSTSLNYPPLNLSTPGYYHCSTSYRTSPSANTYTFNNLTGQSDVNAKANSANSFRVRTFTVTGTTLS